MKLTQSQEAMISRYLRDVNVQLDGVDEGIRRTALTQLKARVEARLRYSGEPSLDDAALARLLEQIGSPADLAANVRRRAAASTVSGSAAPEPDVAPADDEPADARPGVWLGVCHVVSRRIVAPCAAMRFLAVVAGFIFPPITLPAYIAGYFWLRHDGGLPGEPRVDVWRIARHAGLIVALLVGSYACAEFLLWAIKLGYSQVPNAASIGLEARWTWLDASNGRYLIWAMAYLLPLAVLSGLPVHDGWSGTLFKLAQAGVAVYAVFLCWGLASYLAGVALAIAESGGTLQGLETMQDLLAQ